MELSRDVQSSVDCTDACDCGCDTQSNVQNKLFHNIQQEQPKIDHLCTFGCGAYVFIPQKVCKNKLATKTEIMTYLGVAPGGIGY